MLVYDEDDPPRNIHSILVLYVNQGTLELEGEEPIPLDASSMLLQVGVRLV